MITVIIGENVYMVYWRHRYNSCTGGSLDMYYGNIDFMLNWQVCIIYREHAGLVQILHMDNSDYNVNWKLSQPTCTNYNSC